MTCYTDSYARYFDRYAVKWTTEFTDRLVKYSETLPIAERRILDLCCGGGIAVAAFADAGWDVVGIDASTGMLEIARDRLSASGAQATPAPALMVGDARAFTVGPPVAVCISLDGALNHMQNGDELLATFNSVHGALLPGGHFIFDLFTDDHFDHWNHATLTDFNDDMIMKRGVYDRVAGRGMLRVSGYVLGSDHVPMRVSQILAAWYYSPEAIARALDAAGFDMVDYDFEPQHLKCDSGSCSRTSVPCRTIYHAVKRP